MQLNDFDEMKIKNTICKFQKVLSLAFPDKTDLYIGYYALMTSKYLINRYFDEDCDNETDFKHLRKCLVKDLSQYSKYSFPE